MKKEEFDIFVNHHIYPVADSIFDTHLQPLNAVKDDCIFVLDTNALLVPYSTGSQSLSQINEVYERLKKENRLMVPGQVAREFANNRPEKLKEIFQQLTRKQSSIQSLGIGKYPLLEELGEYKRATDIEREINEKLIEYRKAISKLVDEVKLWQWNDPVSLIYREIFTSEIIVDIPIDKEKIKKNLEYRYLHKIPPGFKDNAKEDDGIGDLLIWLTILELGKSKKNVVFVSGDEKNDWYHKSEKQPLYPRFELVHEYKIASEGKTFHIIKLSELLSLRGADEKTVKEVEFEEKISTSFDNFQLFATKAERSIFNWLLLRDDVGVKPNHIGHPDYDVTYDNGTRVGVEVIVLNPRYSVMLSSRIREKIYRAYYETKAKNFDKMQFFFIARDNSFDFSQFKSAVQKVTSDMDRTNVEFLWGYLNDQDEFVLVNQ